MSDNTQPRYYHYDPNLAGNVTFVVLFAIPTLAHIYLMFRKRTWYFIPFIIGCVFETVGYVGRTMSALETPNWTFGPFLMQTLLILLGPAFYAASIYMVLGRLVRMLEAEHHSLVRANWLTKIFVGGDVLSFITQGAGGGILANAESESSESLGQGVVLAGLAIQIFFFGLFMITTVIFDIRIAREPTSKSLSATTAWRQLILVMYISCVTILVRSVFRMIEFGQGPTGYLWAHEEFLFTLDGLLMVIVPLVLIWRHPGMVLIGYKKRMNEEGEQLGSRGDDYPMVAGHRKGDRSDGSSTV